MQFAGGRTIAELAASWERDTGWVEEAVRRALLGYIPRRDGGLKAPRAEERAAHAQAEATAREAQQSFGSAGEWGW